MERDNLTKYVHVRGHKRKETMIGGREDDIGAKEEQEQRSDAKSDAHRHLI